MRARPPLVLFLLSLVGAVGCGGGPMTYEISGTVTYRGKPIETGEISFIPQGEGGAPDGGAIEDGSFRFAAKAGQKRVEIRASRPVPAERQSHPEMGMLYEDYLPPVYNSETTLTAEVSASNREFAFHLDDPS